MSTGRPRSTTGGRPAWRRLGAAVAAAGLLTGCGLLGDAPAAPSGPGPAAVAVSVMPTTDLAPLHLAERNGWFDAEGVAVDTVTVPSGQASLAALIGGDVDVAYGSYTPFFVAQNRGAADLRFVAAASSAAPDATVIVSVPGSPVRTVQDLAGKRVAVTATNTISDVLVKSTMQDRGVDPSGIEWVSVPFPDTAAALERRDVDAAFLTEPFVTLAERSVGAFVVADTSSGTAENLPTAGYAALASYTDGHRDALAAFQRALRRATAATADRSLVEPLLVEHSGIAPDVAGSTALLTFSSTVDPAQLQRVPDLLARFGVIDRPMDAAALTLPAAPR